MYSFAQKVHSHACPDSGYIEGAQQTDNGLQGADNVITGNDHLSMVAADVVGHLLCVFQVNGIGAHADGEGADRLLALPLSNCTDQRGVQSSRQEKSHICVGVKALLDAGHQLLTDIPANRVQVIMDHMIHPCDVAVAGEFAVLVEVSRRKGHDLFAQPNQVFCLACENDSFAVIAVVKRPDTSSRSAVVYHAGEFRIKGSEHIRAHFPVKRKYDLAV